jgi:uncharacterized iron-regulated protein
MNALEASLFLLLFATLDGSQAWAQENKTTAAPRIWDVRSEAFVTEPQLVHALAGARYRLLGEVHDNPQHHVIRARLIAAIAATGVRPAVVFEQFDLDQDAALLAAQKSGTDSDRLADEGHLDRKGWIWPLHKPLIDVALKLGLPVRAGNVPRAMFPAGPSAADEDRSALWYPRFHAARWSEAQAGALHADIVEAHCGKLPETIVPRIVLAQRVRDAAMAQALVDDATSGGAILIAGNGHVRADLGVPVYLHAPGLPDSSAGSVSLGMIEVNADDERVSDFPRQIVAANPGFDYIWFTSPAPREDPCANITGPR